MSLIDDGLLLPRQRVSIVFMLVGLLLILPSCTSVDPVVKIGLVGPFVGEHREVGYDVIYSMRMAVREQNNAGGLNGHRVALAALDDFGDPEIARENALALSSDEAVIAVIGHWLPETTLSAAPIYDANQVPFIETGQNPFGPLDPAALPLDFKRAYEEVTPFDEVAGSYAGAGYDAIQLVFAAVELAAENNGDIDRGSVAAALDGLIHEGITGAVYSAP